MKYHFTLYWLDKSRGLQHCHGVNVKCSDKLVCWKIWSLLVVLFGKIMALLGTEPMLQEAG